MSKFPRCLDFRRGDVGTPWPRHGLSSRALQLGRKTTISVLLTAFLKRLLEERLWQAVEISLSSRTPHSLEYDTSSEDLPASDCHRLGHGFKARLLRPSYRMLPRRKAYRAHAPLFEWTNVGCLQPCQRVPLSSVPTSSSPSSSSIVCLFFLRRTRCR